MEKRFFDQNCRCKAATVVKRPNADKPHLLNGLLINVVHVLQKGKDELRLVSSQNFCRYTFNAPDFDIPVIDFGTFTL